MGMADFVGHPKNFIGGKKMKKFLMSIATLFAMVILAGCGGGTSSSEEIPIHQEYFGLYLDYGQSAYYDDDQGKYVYTDESCPYEMVDGEVDFSDVNTTTDMSPLKHHITRVYDSTEGDGLISCGQDPLISINYKGYYYKFAIIIEEKNELWVNAFINDEASPQVLFTNHEEDTILYHR